MMSSLRILERKSTYVVAALIIGYGVIFRGLGANDWNTGLVMISVALIGICLRAELSAVALGSGDCKSSGK